MKYITVILLFLINLNIACSQGFDWQYSARLPFKTPNTFIGLDGSLGTKFISSDFTICNQNLPCDTFSTGTGMDISAGIKLEFWASSDVSYFTNLNFKYSTNSFTNENLYYYIPEVGNKILEYEYIRTEYIPEIEIGVKYRLRFLLTHLFAALSVRTGFAMSTNEELILRKISEADWLDDETRFTDIKALELSKLTFAPHIKLGYDFSTGLGSYASIYLDIGIPIQNRYLNGSWNSTPVSFGISFFPFGL